jgi:hypothetical protein
VRIHRDLVADHQEQVPSYYSVRRFIARLFAAEDFLDTLVGVYQDQSGSDAACPVLA